MQLERNFHFAWANEFPSLYRRILFNSTMVLYSCVVAESRCIIQCAFLPGHIRLGVNNAVDKPEEEITIEMGNAVSLTFALKYLNNFAKATPLSPTVQLCMSNNHPLCIEYPMSGVGHIRYYLAPKIEEETDWIITIWVAIGLAGTPRVESLACPCRVQRKNQYHKSSLGPVFPFRWCILSNSSSTLSVDLYWQLLIALFASAENHKSCLAVR